MEGTQGWIMFKDVIGRMDNVKQLFSKSQKLKLAALKRRAGHADLFGDWKPMIDEAFALWDAALA